MNKERYKWNTMLGIALAATAAIAIVLITHFPTEEPIKLTIPPVPPGHPPLDTNGLILTNSYVPFK